MLPLVGFVTLDKSKLPCVPVFSLQYGGVCGGGVVSKSLDLLTKHKQIICLAQALA